MNHSSEIISSPVYAAPSWRWNEVPKFSFSNCSLVSYMPNTDCRFPVSKIRDTLDSSTIECLISLGRMQGLFERIAACWSDYATARTDLLMRCDLSRDEAIKVRYNANCTDYMRVCVYYAHGFISKALRFSAVVKECTTSISRLSSTLANEVHSSDWVKLKEILEAEPFVVLLSAIRNTSEHNDGYISPVNYSSQDQTFGLAINLESGIVSDRNNISMFRRTSINQDGKTMLDWLDSFCQERYQQGKMPFLSFASFYQTVSDYIAVEGLAFLDTFCALCREQTTEVFNLLDLIDDNHSIGLFVDITRGANPNERPFNWYMSDRLYPLMNAAQFDELCDSLADLLCDSIDAQTKSVKPQ